MENVGNGEPGMTHIELNQTETHDAMMKEVIVEIDWDKPEMAEDCIVVKNLTVEVEKIEPEMAINESSYVVDSLTNDPVAAEPEMAKLKRTNLLQNLSQKWPKLELIVLW